jgi:hypothetical protein
VTSPDTRASDAERERVASQLRDQLADGRLTLEELSERLDAAYRARTVGELDELTRDLPAAATATAGERTPRWVVAVLGGVERKRRWRVPERLNAVAVMGSIHLDLRAAAIASAEVEIVAVALMGSVEIVVPEGVDVEVGGFAVMGAREEKVVESPPVPGAPRIHVRAYALMGTVEVRSTPRPFARPPGPPHLGHGRHHGPNDG